ncbi:hypothetical protein ERN12_16795 [Rhodobacteraceae bacterium]|nr:hypothetical protein ERN12_16795 [Paracoccaceae bacterium]
MRATIKLMRAHSLAQGLSMIWWAKGGVRVHLITAGAGAGCRSGMAPCRMRWVCFRPVTALRDRSSAIQCLGTVILGAHCGVTLRAL